MHDCYYVRTTMINKKQLPHSDKRQRLTPEQVVKTLKEKETIVSISQAEEMLTFMRKMAKIALRNYLDQHCTDVDRKINDKVLIPKGLPA